MYIKNNTFTKSFKGWSPENINNKIQIEKMKDIIEDPTITSVAISGHSCPDGDSVGSEFAMAYLLNTKKHIPIDVYVSGGLSKKYNFLRGENINIIEGPVNINKEKKYDLAISLDTATSALMDKWFYSGIFSNANKKIKIDHHETGEDYADINLTDKDASCASQIVMQLVKPLGLEPATLPEGFNNAVYTGIISDTGRFSYTKSALPFKDAALLIENGLNPDAVNLNNQDKISKEVNDVIMLAQKKLKVQENIGYLVVDNELTEAINNLKVLDTKRDAISKIKKMTFDLKNVEGIDVTLFCNSYGNNYKISSRSDNYNVLDVAIKHGGGGHLKASAFPVAKTNDSVKDIDDIIKEYQMSIKEQKECAKKSL